MNKTIIININGIIFHIEEDAYEVLQKYMTDVKRHFMDSADSLEITTDIENRIAEMFTEILSAESKQVIVEQDVTTVINKMGTVADFASAGEEENKNAGHRAYQYQTANRRLFRDSDDHLAGGVCAGIANYFDLQPVWVRVAFAITCCFYGAGLVLYFILWIVIPRAVTRTDRMAMKGEPLDLQGFKRNFEDEMKGVKGHAATLHAEAQPFIYKTRDFAGEFFEHLRQFLSTAGNVLLKVLGLFILIDCFAFLIALLVAAFALIAFNSQSIASVVPISMVNHQYRFPFFTGAFFLLALPVLALLFLTRRVAFDRPGIGRTTGYTMLIIWIAALCTVAYYSVQVATEFKSHGTISQTINIKPAAGKVYHLKMNDVRYLSSEDSANLDIKQSFGGKMVMDDDRGQDDMVFRGRGVVISIEKSDVQQPVLVENFKATGSSYTNALINAHNIIYRFTQTDSLLTFDRHIQLAGKSAWRMQYVFLSLKIPIGTELVIDKDARRYLQNVDFDNCRDRTTLEHSRTAPFMMTEDGLQCFIPAMPDSTDVKKR